MLPLLVLLLFAVMVAPAGAMEVHAHRGGALANGVPVQPENTLEAFRNAHATGADVIELDTKLTADGVPVVIHDATLDRTTDCAGQVRSLTARALARRCRVDILGTSGNFVPVEDSDVRVPTLRSVLRWAKRNGAVLNLEIKNMPTDPDFDPTPAFARRVLDVIDRSGIRRSQVLVQSFWPPNLDEAKGRGYRASFLTLQQMNDGGVAFAKARGYDVLSPGWEPSALYPQLASAAGLPWVPYTLNTEAQIRKAGAMGAQAVITDDPTLALALTR